MEARDLRPSLARAAAEPYRKAGLFARKFAQGKLTRDPSYMGILERSLLPGGDRIVDLGCGQGLVAAWLNAARTTADRGEWPSALPLPPRFARYTGVELMESDVARARRAALGDHVEFVTGDLRTVDFGTADAVIILDVLHYMDIAAQDAVLERIRAALSPSSGRLLLRIGDAAGGWRFAFSRAVDHVVTFIRGHRLTALHCRPLVDWTSKLQSLGFTVDAHPMSEGTPFANVLLVARLG